VALPSPIVLQAQSRHSAGSIKTSACRRPAYLSFIQMLNNSIVAWHNDLWPSARLRFQSRCSIGTRAKSEECFAMRASCLSSTSLSQFLFLMARLRLPCAAASSCGRCKSIRLVLNLLRFRRRNTSRERVASPRETWRPNIRQATAIPPRSSRTAETTIRQPRLRQAITTSL
jgi:hypothetical protein